MKKIAIIVALLILPLSAYSTMIFFAYTSDSGAEEHRAYERSKHFDEEKKQRKRFDALGLTLEAKPLFESDQRMVELKVLRKQQPLDRVRITFKRPSDASADFIVPWDSSDDVVRTAVPLKGRWYIEYAAVYGDEVVRTRRELYVP